MSDLFVAVDQAIRSPAGAPARWRFFVPGRLEVFGKHTDYAGGRSLVAAVPRGFAVAALPTDDDMVRVVDARSGAGFACGVLDAPVTGVRWHRYVTTVVHRLVSNFPGANFSARIVFASNLPPASGISSSSALVIAIAEALIARSGIEETPRWKTAIGSIEDRASYFGCIENGASFGALAGDKGVGTHGGSEDHAAILSSRAGVLQMFSYCPLRRERAVRMPEGWTFVVASSGVRASKTGAARGDYNRLSADAAAIARLWRERHPEDARPLGQLAREGQLADLAVAPDLRPRLEHFLAEDARVGEAARAFASGDIGQIGTLAEASQQDAARLLANQVPETKDLVTLAKGLGAPAACAFGAGWGGSVWALVPAIDASEFLGRWLGAYRERYPSRQSEGFLAPPSEGIRTCS